MKILVFGLTGAELETLLTDERLVNFRRLMEFGCYGQLKSSGDPGNESAWMTFAYSRTTIPGNQQPIGEGTAIWEHIAGKSSRAILVGVPPFLGDAVVVHARVEKLDVGYPVEASDTGSLTEGQLLAEIVAMNEWRLKSVIRVLHTEAWDYLQFSDSGLAHLRKGLEGQASQEAMRDYYLCLDQQLSIILDALTDDTVLAVISPQTASQVEGTAGSFILAAANSPLEGEVVGARLIDMAPTLLELGGYDVPTSMQGRSLVAGSMVDIAGDEKLSEDEEELLRERLSGLGYI